MPEAIIRFSRCILDSQDYGSDDEHMVSRVFFTLKAGGRVYPDLTCDVKQAVGEPFDKAALEVSRPRRYDGSLDYAPFRQAVEDYYRSMVGSLGSVIRIAGGGNVRMRNQVLAKTDEERVRYSEESLGW